MTSPLPATLSPEAADRLAAALIELDQRIQEMDRLDAQRLQERTSLSSALTPLAGERAGDGGHVEAEAALLSSLREVAP